MYIGKAINSAIVMSEIKKKYFYFVFVGIVPFDECLQNMFMNCKNVFAHVH